MSQDSPQNKPDKDIFDELEPEKTFSFFILFRYSGMLFLFSSMFFLFQKHKDPILRLGENEFRNGQVGNLLLTVGTGLFFVYLVHKIYSVITKN